MVIYKIIIITAVVTVGLLIYKNLKYLKIIYNYYINKNKNFKIIEGTSVGQIRFKRDNEDQNVYIEYRIPRGIRRLKGQRVIVEYQDKRRIDITQPIDIPYSVTADLFGAERIVTVNYIDDTETIIKEFKGGEIPRIN